MDHAALMLGIANVIGCRKRAYLLQSYNVLGELQCYYTKISFEDQVDFLPYGRPDLIAMLKI